MAGRLVLRNVTITGNGGPPVVGGALVTARNALIADNESGCGEPITSSFGLSDDGDCVAEGTTSNLVVNDAGLHELGEYGGGTETFALELGRRASTARRP